MTSDLKAGTVVRVRQFPFTDQVGAKTAPVVVLSSQRYHQERDELIGARITSKLAHKDTFGTISIHNPEACGLSEPSVIKPVIMTVLVSQVQRVAGQLDDVNLARAEACAHPGDFLRASGDSRLTSALSFS